jgi:hypothetical protein
MDMDTREVEITRLTDDELDAVAGGWKNIPVINASQQRDLAPEIALTKPVVTAPGANPIDPLY